MNRVDEIIGSMMSQRQFQIKRWTKSWGNREECKRLFCHIFCSVDPTLDFYYHLPEYDMVIDWMTSTDDKGLMLMGDCGRGKSIIITRVIPILLRMLEERANPYPVHASELASVYPNAHTTENYKPTDTNLVYLTRTPYPIIDEVGVEPMMNNYGEKSEGFNQIVNVAERYHRPMFVTTNLTPLQLLDRYGERTMDRLAHLCRTINFQGDSLRK
ncbi:MAG: ATP-binding protein [Tidjanibacter sp.]|jgi:DNA replication protein DnaC|nr:ATP-binding protein [Tidjanibacter sp.]